MMREGKRNVLGILVDIIDYDSAVDAIVSAAQQKAPFAVTALAVHGLMIGVLDREHQYRLNCFDLVVPDGQPVRWALNWLHGASLRDRVYGPKLMLAVCRRAEREGLPVFLYGSTQEVLLRTKENLLQQFPRLSIAGTTSSRFGHLTPAEKEALVASIRGCGASIVFVALGCPRQEIWAYEYRACLSLPVIAVGAAFPFIAGTVAQAPPWMQKRGLEWLFRLGTEPLRLWRRYLILNPMYLLLLSVQLLGLHDFSCSGRIPKKDLSYG